MTYLQNEMGMGIVEFQNSWVRMMFFQQRHLSSVCVIQSVAIGNPAEIGQLKTCLFARQFGGH